MDVSEEARLLPYFQLPLSLNRIVSDEQLVASKAFGNCRVCVLSRGD
jgi:hypothetical protein